MKKVIVSSQNNSELLLKNKNQRHLDANHISPLMKEKVQKLCGRNVRPCPSCSHLSIAEMPGGRDATCKVCGFKDPCCYD